MTIDFAPPPSSFSLLRIIGSIDHTRMWREYFFVGGENKGVEHMRGEEEKEKERENN